MPLFYVSSCDKETTCGIFSRVFPAANPLYTMVRVFSGSTLRCRGPGQMSFSLPAEDVAALEQFLTRRQVRGKILPLILAAKCKHSLNRADVSTAKNMTYSNLTGLIIKCIDKSWVNYADFAEVLDDSEVAGRQHVCIFKLPDNGKVKILDALRAPRGLSTSTPAIHDFIRVPSQSAARILVDTTDEVVVKIIAIRTYWLSEFVKDDPGDQLIHRWEQKERSAVIVKANLQTGLLQVRVPPRETGPSDTANGVYKFMSQALGQHYGGDGSFWLDEVLFFPIADAYPKILQNKTEFVLRHDTPENATLRSRMSKKGPTTDLSDLRDDPNWRYENGYARRTMRGHWSCVSSQLFMHMHYDTIQIDKKTTRDLARVFVPKYCPDGELDHAIERIRNHL